MHDTTNQDTETTLFPSVPSTDEALATPPVSARAASGAAATRKAAKKPSASQEGFQEPPEPKAVKGAKKPARATRATPASAEREPGAEPRIAPSEPKPAATPETAVPTAPPKAPKPSKKPAPGSMPQTPALDAAKPWLAKVSDATLADAAKGFLEKLEADGASESTVSGYRRELNVAMDHFGEAKLLALIQPHEVQAYFECPAVMVARNGSPKAQPSYDRTRRVLRLALCWAVEHGLLETAPLPASN